MPTETATLGVRAVRAFTDNYIWLIEAPGHRLIAVDPGEAAPVKAELERSEASLAAILLTHHHADHIGGVAELLADVAARGDGSSARRAGGSARGAAGPVRVIGPADPRIPFGVETVGDGDRCEFPDLGLGFDILHVPGHTLSHIAFFGHGALFCGDTLFSAGCGRMFEGTPKQMWASLNRLRNLPPETLMYCGHEYTAANLRFALAAEPANTAAIEYRDRVARVRAADLPTLPSTLSLERRVNPFLRCDEPAVRLAAAAHAGRPVQGDDEVFGTLRAWKDQFR